MNPIPLPYRILAIVVLALSCGAAGWVKGVHHQKDKDALEKAAIERAAHDAYVAQAEKLNLAADTLEKAKNEKRIIYRTITRSVDKIVDRPVYHSACIDDDGLRLINAAAAGKAPADSGQPGAAVPAPGAAAGNDRR